MPAYAPEPETTPGRGQGRLAIVFLVLALATSYLPEGAQQRVAWSLRVTVLRPFLATQQRLTDARLRASQVDVLQARLDSLTAVVATQGALADENLTLRNLLELRARTGPAFVPATVIRPGTPGSESMFLVEVGSDHGVEAGAPVVTRHGLAGRILEVRGDIAVGMDWTHPDFRVSAMLADGTTFGMVENQRGTFREQDRLVLNGTAYHQSIARGVPVLTSGLGGVFPRGIPVGIVDELRDETAGWRKSYWLQPMVEPGALTHVLVAAASELDDLDRVWPTDSLLTREQSVVRGRIP